MRAGVIIAALLVASVAHAAEIAVKYKPPYYLDDVIPFSIDTPLGATVRASESPVNLTIQDGPAVAAGTRTRKWFLARPLSDGPARIPPYTITGGVAPETTPAVTLNVLPVRLSDNPDASAVLQRMRESGRPPVIGRVIVRPQTAYAGEIVQIVWAAIADQRIEMTMRDAPNLEGAVEVPRDRSDALDVSAGGLEHRTEVRRAAWVPQDAGSFLIPPATLEGTFVQDGVTEPIVRMTPRQVVRVLPVPEELPPGKYTLSVSPLAKDGRLSIDVRGPGDAGVTHPPLFAGVDATYVLKPQPLNIEGMTGVRTWDVEFHPGDRPVNIGTVTFTSWDRDQQRPVTVEQRVDATVPAKGERVRSETPVKRPLIGFLAIDVLLLVGLIVANRMADV